MTDSRSTPDASRLTRADLLIEIGTEELPPKALKSLSEAFGAGLMDGLAQAGIEPGGITLYAAPRRLAALIEGVAEKQDDQVIERRGPALQAAFDEEGVPTKAAEGFAASCGVEVSDLEKLETDKGAWLSYKLAQPGKAAAELVPAIVEKALAGLPIPKRMRWGAGEAEFVRPVHWVVLLFGDEVIDATILGVPAGRETRGHRFHHPEPLSIAEPKSYAPMLQTEGHVMPDFAARREAIYGQVQEAAHRLGGTAVIDEDLLDEVTALVEWPSAVSGGFEKTFLDVPQEALISTMQDNQKYFAVVDGQGALMPHFITISNIESRDPDKVREGNERVIRPRFADAAFFWTQDRKKPLADYAGNLKTIVFQKDLGTVWEKSQRVARLAGFIAQIIGADKGQAMRAAELAKCDLVTSMVYEFPELQGIMGRYYARHAGEPEAVANALDEQYMPRHAGDDLPAGDIGQVLSLAEKLDTLLGIFAIGQKPTGTKDPFALRRAALGVLRTIIEKGRDLDLEVLLNKAADGLADKVDAKQAVGETFDYILERLKAYYTDRGIAGDVIDAVMAQRPTRPLDFDQRVRAVEAFRQLPEAASLAAANKRIQNILKKVEGEPATTIDRGLLQEPAEAELADRLAALSEAVAPDFANGDYAAGLTKLAALREAVDRFFDEVMVMAEDEALRNNRIALLNTLGGLFLRTADLSRLQG
ncbi:MAG: glycine--tRNA ligase subunit beta [Gammaproteobacteria bacterium]|nr:glycine--tRNA ligase subunit beta [Gammaproteobacteria bacterium]